VLIEAEDPEYVDQGAIEMPSGQLKGLIRAGHGFRHDTEGVEGLIHLDIGLQHDRGTLRERPYHGRQQSHGSWS
jgi:hypothetical protein